MDRTRSALGDAADALSLRIERSTLDALARYSDILATRAVDAGLVSGADRERVLERHVADCMRVLPLLGPEDHSCLDLGSGAGLPGLVVAIAMPALEVQLVESRRRRVAFLEFVTDSLELPNVRIVHSRIEDITTQVDVCLARALAPLEKTWDLARGLLRPSGRLLYFAGSKTEIRVGGPGAPSLQAVPSPLLESSGPLVIMTRQ